MKKIALTSLLAMFAVSAANAETNYFVGGGFGLYTNTDHISSFNIAPEFGWKYNADWDFGVDAKVGMSHDYYVLDGMTFYDEDINEYDYGAHLFARYNVAEFGGFKLLLKGSVGADFTTYSDGDDTETTSMIGMSVIPMITYDISESFTLYAQLKFLGMYAGYQFKNDTLDVNKGWAIGVFGDTGNIANTEDFQIGFTYNF